VRVEKNRGDFRHEWSGYESYDTRIENPRAFEKYMMSKIG